MLRRSVWFAIPNTQMNGMIRLVEIAVVKSRDDPGGRAGKRHTPHIPILLEQPTDSEHPLSNVFRVSSARSSSVLELILVWYGIISMTSASCSDQRARAAEWRLGDLDAYD